MKAILFTYKTNNISKNESSKISKKIKGYEDKSNQSKYNYHRKGLVESNGGIVVSKSTFIIPQKAEKQLDFLRKKGITLKKWKIDIPKSSFFN